MKPASQPKLRLNPAPMRACTHAAHTQHTRTRGPHNIDEGLTPGRPAPVIFIQHPVYDWGPASTQRHVAARVRLVLVVTGTKQGVVKSHMSTRGQRFYK